MLGPPRPVDWLLLGGVFSAQFGMAAVWGSEAGLSLRDISIFIAAALLTAAGCSDCGGEAKPVAAPPPGEVVSRFRDDVEHVIEPFDITVDLQAGLPMQDMTCPSHKTSIAYDGLTVDCAAEHGATFLLRGIRSNADLAYEKPTSLINRHLNSGIDTLYLHSFPETSHISSTIVREVIKYQGKLEGLLPEEVVGFIKSRKYDG